MSDYSGNGKVDEIYSKVINILRPYHPCEATNALSEVLGAIMAMYCLEEGIDCNDILKDLFADIKGITQRHIKENKNVEIKVKV